MFPDGHLDPKALKPTKELETPVSVTTPLVVRLALDARATPLPLPEVPEIVRLPPEAASVAEAEIVTPLALLALSP